MLTLTDCHDGRCCTLCGVGLTGVTPPNLGLISTKPAREAAEVSEARYSPTEGL